MISVLLVLVGLIGISVVVDPSEERFPTIKDASLIIPCR